jgi:hypothetical protein
MQDLLTGKVRVTNLLKEREPTSLWVRYTLKSLW